MVSKSNFIDGKRDYLLSAINSANLLANRFPGYKARQLHRHVPQAFIRSILEKIDFEFREQISETRKSRRRSPHDINITSFFYHHYALASGAAIPRDVRARIIRPNNISQIIQAGMSRYKFFCVNDGEGSSLDKDFSEKFSELMQKSFPNPSQFEFKEKTFQRAKLSITIMAHTSRAHRIPEIRAKIGNCTVSLDDGSLGIVENSLRSWRMHDPSKDFHLVL